MSYFNLSYCLLELKVTEMILKIEIKYISEKNNSNDYEF